MLGLFSFVWLVLILNQFSGWHQNFFLSIKCAVEGVCKDFFLSAGQAYFSKLVSIMLILLISQTGLYRLCIQCLLSK